MKLDTRAIRYLTSEDWRVLTAVSRFAAFTALFLFETDADEAGPRLSKAAKTMKLCPHLSSLKLQDSVEALVFTNAYLP